MTAVVVPVNPRAERAVLGAVLADGDAAVAVAGAILKPEDFSDAGHQAVFRAALALVARGVTPDLLTLAGELGDKVTASGLSGLVEELPDTANVAAWAGLVRDAARRRRLQRIALTTLAATGGNETPTEEILETASQRLAELGSGAEDAAVEACDAAAAALECARAHARGEGGDAGVRLGYHLLDEALGGLAPGDLAVLAAMRAVGKSAAALQVGSHVAIEQRKSVLYVSLEMSAAQLGDRLLAQGSGIAVGRIHNGKLDGVRWSDTGGDWPLVEKARKRLEGARFLIVDRGNLTLPGIRALARARQLRVGLDLVVIDYLQLIQPDGKGRSTVEEVTRATRELKLMAMALQVPVLVLSQINRSPDKRAETFRRRPAEGRDPGEPTLSDLSWSGSIERDADDVILLHRRIEGSDLEITPAVAILAKHRQGPTCRQPLRFEPHAVRFRETL